jgi:hypothetical protein
MIGVQLMLKDTKKSRTHNKYADLAEHDNQIDSSILHEDKLKKVIDDTWDHAITKGNGFLFDPKLHISIKNTPSISDMVLMSVCYRDAMALNKGYNLLKNPCIQLNVILISIYEINFYVHNIDKFRQKSHKDNFTSWVDSLSFDSFNPKSQEDAASESKAVFDENISIGEVSVLDLYESRLSTLNSFNITTVSQYLHSMSSGFCDLSIDLKMFSLDHPLILEEYTSGLRLLLTHEYSDDAIKESSEKSIEKSNEILITSTPSLFKLAKASELQHSAPRFNNLILDSGLEYVKKEHHLDSDEQDFPYSTQASSHTWR